MLNKPVSEIMATGQAIPKVKSGTFFRDALEELTEKHLGGVVIVDNEDKVVGIISDGDLKRILLNNDDPLPKLYNDYVEEHMVKSTILSVKPDTTIEDALRAMHEKTIWCMPVTDENDKLVGFFQMKSVINEVVTDSKKKR